MAGKPKVIIDWNVVDEYLRAHCDGAAIARLIGIHPNTLYNTAQDKFGCNFSEYAQQKRAEGVAMVENSLYKDALTKGGVDRLFWLKNKAAWQDKQDHNITGNLNLHFDKEDEKL